MKPLEANFDGTEGIRMNHPSYPNAKFALRRGKVKPKPDARFENELIWWYPEGEDPRLLYINANGKFYELDFQPLEHPPWSTND